MSKKFRGNKHHRKPRSLGGTDEARNISVVCRDKHAAFHLLFKNHPPERIAMIINNVWLDPDYVFIAVKKEDLK